MRRKGNMCSVSQLVSGILMIFALSWLTVSTPFVYKAQQAIAKQQKAVNHTEDTPGDTEESTPFGNNEEKTETSVNVLSEYLHHTEDLSYLSVSLQRHHGSHESKEYVAFHGEMLCPPPNCICA